MKKIVIFGSTGSIGTSLLKIIKKDKKNLNIELLSANKNYKKLIKQAIYFNVKNLIIADQNSFLKAKKIIKNRNINVYNNFLSFNKIFKNKKIDYTMSAITGLQGLKPTLDIIKFTKTIAIANKESIICGWSLIKKNLKRYKTLFIPVDSEHFSIWSLIKDEKNNVFENIYLTASGGPFRKYPFNKFHDITPAKALKHPNWSMGEKISIDSATMINKVFEIIEAKKIFNLKYKQLKILIHPKSYLHAIVKYKNGLIKLLIHDTNMTIPIFNSIYQNHEKNIQSQSLNINLLNNLNIEQVDMKRFPLVKIINDLPESDSLFETIIVSANDRLVQKFLNREISFLDISKMLIKLINLKEFQKYKKISTTKITDITKLSKLVSLKVDTLCI